MFEGSASTEKIVSNVEKMIGLEVGKFEFQYFDGIEGINESALNDQLMNECESSVGDGGCLFGEFESNGGGGKLRGSEGSLQAISAEGNGALVGIENIVYICIHLKSFVEVY